MAELRTDDLLIPQGVTWEVRWPLLESDGSPVDLTGWGVRSQVRKSASSLDVLHEWSSAAGNAELVDSAVVLSVAPEVSSAWTWTAGVYDVELFHADGRVLRMTQGKVKISAEITR